LENIVQWLQNGENEKQICEKLKFCSSFTKVETVTSSRTACAVCEVVAETVGYYLHKDEAQIKSAISSACGKLGPLATTCQNYADKQLHSIIVALNQGKSVAQICESLDACPKKQETESAHELMQEADDESIHCTSCHPTSVQRVLCETVALAAGSFANKDQDKIEAAISGACKKTRPSLIAMSELRRSTTPEHHQVPE
jgi:hypothetical protein